MKKITALLLLASTLSISAVFAEEAPVLISENAPVAAETVIAENMKDTVISKVKAISDEQIELEDNLVLNIDENTFIGDYAFNPIEGLKVGDEVYAITSTAKTFSIPAQTYAYYILAKTEEDMLPPTYATVESVEDGEILTADGKWRVTYENAQVSMFRVKSIIKADELTPGSEIVFYSDMMTMSIPALVNPTKILVLNVADENAPANDETADETSKEISIVANDAVLDLSTLPVAPYEEGETIMVPLRKIGEALGYTIGWDDNTKAISVESETQKAVLHNGSSEIEFDVKNAKAAASKVNTVIHEGCTFVPVEFFASFSNDVSVEGNVITISSAKAE